MILLVRFAGAAIVLGLAVGLLIKFDLVIVLCKMLLIAWHWLISFKVLAKVYLLRQIMSPFWRIITKSLITILGLRLFGIFKSKLTLAVDVVKYQFDQWSKMPFWLRWGLFSGSLFAVGIFGFGLYILPIWIPFLQPAFRKLHMWWFETITTRWLRPARMKLRYWLRNNSVMRVLRKPHRIVLYFVVIGIRRTARYCLSIVVTG